MAKTAEASTTSQNKPGEAFIIYRRTVYILSLIIIIIAAAYGCLPELIRGFCLVLPALIANGTPVVVSKKLIKGGLHPVDFGKTIRGRRILGEGKTWEGTISGIVAGLVIGIPVALYFKLSIWFGGVIATLALLGDMVGSFVKRMAGLPRGACVVLLDQLDFYVFALLGLYWMGLASMVSPRCWILLGVVVAALHLATNYLAYKVGWKQEEC